MSASPDSPAPEETRRRVLVVDDDRDAVAMMDYLLRLRGYEVRKAYDGVRALEAAQEFRPQVIVLDLVLPEMDGWEMAKRLRREPWGRGIRVIALSGYGEPRHKRRAQEAGCDYHITKPVVDFAAFLALFDAVPGSPPNYG
ncbi:MAG TPA: response regulator [Pirellulales bacterium]